MASEARRRVGRPRDDESGDTRALLLAVAAKHLSVSGYAKTTFRAIARDAHVTVGAVYYYFPTKVALIEAIIDEVNLGILPTFDRVFEERSFPARVEAMLVAITMAAPNALGGVGNFLLIDAPRYDELRPTFDRWVAGHEEVLARIVREAIDAGELPPDTNEQSVVDLLRALVFGVSALFSPSPERVHGVGRAATTLLLGSNEPAPKAGRQRARR